MAGEPKSCDTALCLWVITAADDCAARHIAHTSPRTITDTLVRMVALLVSAQEVAASAQDACAAAAVFVSSPSLGSVAIGKRELPRRETNRIRHVRVNHASELDQTY